MELDLLKGIKDLDIDEKSDPLLAADFDIIEYFNKNYHDEKSLENIASEIQRYDIEMKEIDESLKTCIRQQAYCQEQTREQLNKINQEAIILIDKI
jgi:hypothetical protein